MKETILKFLFFVAILAVIVSLIMAILATVGAVKITEGCLYRYNISDDEGKITNGDKVTASVTLNANGNYTSVESKDSEGSLMLVPDPNRYGEWVNTNFYVNKSQKIAFTVKGEVSLCRAYLPINNIQSLSNVYTKDNNGHKKGERIPIPRVEEANIPPLSLSFDAKIGQWRNIAELYSNDHVIISVSPDNRLIKDSAGGVIRKSQDIPFTDVFSGDRESVDCSERKTDSDYKPICGRYTIYSGQYVSNCEYKTDCKCTI